MYVVKHSSFWKETSTVNQKIVLKQNPQMICLRKINMTKFNYFIRRPNKVKQRFEVFLIDQYADDIWNKTIPGM